MQYITLKYIIKPTLKHLKDLLLRRFKEKNLTKHHLKRIFFFNILIKHTFKQLFYSNTVLKILTNTFKRRLLVNNLRIKPP